MLCIIFKHTSAIGRTIYSFCDNVSQDVITWNTTILNSCKTQTKLSRSNKTVLPNYFEVTEEGFGVLEFALNVDGDHPRTSGALSLHHFMLRVRGQAYVEREKIGLHDISRLVGCNGFGRHFADESKMQT